MANNRTPVSPEDRAREASLEYARCALASWTRAYADRYQVHPAIVRAYARRVQAELDAREGRR